MSWRNLMVDQAGVVSLEQLGAHGQRWADIDANVRASRWQRVLPRVYATFTGDLNRAARLHAALLYGGTHAVLSHHTAAEEWGIIPVADRPVEITVPYTCSAVSQLPLVRVHRSRALRYSTLATTPPRTRLTDTVVDLAVAQRTSRDAMYLVIDQVSRQRVSVAALMASLENRQPWRYRAAIMRGLEMVRAGVMSALEAEYAEAVERAHGLPSGQRQTPVEVDGKTLWEDVTYDCADVALTVRLDGRRDHATPGVAFRDMRRDNAAELAGRSRLVYGWRDVHESPCMVAAEVRTVLTREGWWPADHPRVACPRCSVVVSAAHG